MRKYNKLTQEEKAYIREHAPKSTYAQVARELGRLPATVIYFAHRNGIEFSKDAFRSALGANFRSESSRDREARFRKLSQTRKNIIAKERRRVRWGLEQQTKIKACAMPRDVRVCRYNLRARCDYVLENCRILGNDPYAIYYDSETRRSPNEAYFTEKYGFKFIPLDE